MGLPRTLTNRGQRSRRGSADRTPVAHLVRVLGYEHPTRPGSRHELGDIDEVLIGRGDTTQVSRDDDRVLRVDVADPRMSQKHARLARDGGGWVVTDLGSRNGTFVDGARVESAEVDERAILELGRTAFVLRTFEPGDEPDLNAATMAPQIGVVRTLSAPFATALANLARVAAAGQDIVLRGDTGTGKELLARGVHEASKRSGELVAVNCGALPATLVESELFGYKKGAFSGALEDRQGLVRAADGGTLFLDEIGDLPLATQASLLRVLQEREVTPLGATRPVPVRFGVVAASHRDLEQEVSAGRFREDLLARLAGYVVAIPALRDRREDLGLLVAALLQRQGGAATAIKFSPAAGYALVRYGWPRNVRELGQVLTTAVALAVDGTVELEHLPAALQAGPTAAPVEDLSPSELKRRDELRALLAKHKGNLAAVGRELGVARMQIHRWLERYAIDLASYRRDDA